MFINDPVNFSKINCQVKQNYSKGTIKNFDEKTTAPLAGPEIGNKESRDYGFDLEKQESTKVKDNKMKYVSVIVLLLFIFDRYMWYSSNGF